MIQFDPILASASPRRLELLRSVGIEPRVQPADVDESPIPGESPEAMALRLAQVKGRGVRAKLRGATPFFVLAADTVVVLDGEALGKPSGPEEATEMLSRLSGRTHRVCTGLFLTAVAAPDRTEEPTEEALVAETLVQFADLDAAWIQAYIGSGEPFGKAGAYAIQGRAALMIPRIEGSWSNVVGLPLERLPAALRNVGVQLEPCQSG